jgi:hypothetical protein
MRKFYSLVAAVAAAIVLMNLPRIDRTNPPEDPAETLASQTRITANVDAIFRRACENCHSERTAWPWYSAVAPFHWLMTADVYAARQHLNMSTWGRYDEEERTGALIAILRGGGQQQNAVVVLQTGALSVRLVIGERQESGVRLEQGGSSALDPHTKSAL